MSASNFAEISSGISWNAQGLVPAIAQDVESKDILMMAWMDEKALQETLESGFMVYYSRSREKLWRKGEQSGHRQQLHELRLDCDGDVLVALVTQAGGIACHTGRKSCFFQKLEQDGWKTVEPVLKDPKEIYT